MSPPAPKRRSPPPAPPGGPGLRSSAAAGSRPGGAAPAPRPLNDAERDELQALLDRIPAPLEPLDVSMLDGYLCGVLVQPDRLPAARWLPHVGDVDGRPLPAGFDAGRLEALVLRRHAELDDAIGRRQWFDPWVYELEDEDVGRADHPEGDRDADEDDGDAAGDLDAPPQIDAVYPWVAGFATALELFPGLMRRDATALEDALALLYRHLAPDDLEDADDLLATIEALEPPADLAEAVEGLVRATLLLADVGRPLSAAAVAKRASAPRRAVQRRR